MRISDFLELQYRAAYSLTAMNERVMEILSDELVSDIRESVDNINDLTQKATTTIDKAMALIDSSKDELDIEYIGARGSTAEEIKAELEPYEAIIIAFAEQ